MPVVDNLTITPYTALYTNAVSDSIITASTSNREGRTEIVLDFNNGDGLYFRDLESAFSWPISSGTILYTWQPSCVLLPENVYDRASDWVDLGGAKFIQGYSIMADSFNVPKTLKLQSGDDQSIHSFVEIPSGGVAFNKQTRKVFSCVPFVCHTLRRVSDDGVEWRVWEEQPIFQPFPEMQENWTTELTSLGGVGWQHLRYMDIPYLSNSDITITFFVDTGNDSIAPQPIILPSSGGMQTKSFTQLTPNKWKLIGFSATSSSPFALWLPELEIMARSWGSSGPYRTDHPFGGPSSPSAPV